MLLSDQQLVKEDIVKTIAQAVKLLQEECISETNSLQIANSDNQPTQIFTAALEAAFLHGLKKGNYEKQKPHTNTPRPHFWNLIRRISHSDAIAEIKKMKCIDSHVGQSRAWLRWILNESVVTSYLSSFLLNKEYKTILTRYYEAHALFRDDEQSDLFLRYLQGAEYLRFKLTCNSSVLNNWTRTPLQFAGLSASSSIRRSSSYLQVSRSPAQGMRHSSSFSHTGEYLRLPPSRHGSFQSSNMSISPASSFGSQRSISPYIRVLAKSVEEAPHSNLVEVLPSAGQAFSTRDEQEEFDGAVLHTRHVKRRKGGNRAKRKQADDSTNCGSDSRSGSLSSIFSLESASSRAEGNDPSTKTSSSGSSNTASPLLQHVAVQADSEPLEINLKLSVEASTQTKCDATDNQTSHCDAQLTSHPTDKINSSNNLLSSPISNGNATLDVIEEAAEVVALPLLHSKGHEDCRDSLPSSQDVTTHSVNAPEADQTQSNPASSPIQPTTAIQSVKHERICREGFLQRKGDALRIWRTRWFTLNDGILSYYKNQKCQETLGSIFLCDVETIDEEDMAKSKGICLKMQDGVEHQLAADSKSVLSSWVNDIKKAVEGCQRSNDFDDNLKSTENGFEVWEGHNLDKDDSSDPHKNNDDLLEPMKRHMAGAATETSLHAQNHKCADCSSSIESSFVDQRLCLFTGKYHCSECHRNDEHLLPARMISKWDFKKYKVSKKSKMYLERIWKEPWIEMDRINPSAHEHQLEMELVLSLRAKLVSIHRYISTCRIIPAGLFNSKLKGHDYMVELPHLISAHDLYKAHSGDLGDMMHKAVTFGAEHIRSCQLCSVKGFVCEICRKDEVIFPFETKKVKECVKCQSVYHKGCFNQVTQCPKCERRERRLKRQFKDNEDDE